MEIGRNASVKVLFEKSFFFLWKFDSSTSSTSSPLTPSNSASLGSSTVLWMTAYSFKLPPSYCMFLGTASSTLSSSSVHHFIPGCSDTVSGIRNVVVFTQLYLHHLLYLRAARMCGGDTMS